MIRELRRTDTARMFSLMDREFPEESVLLGGRLEGFEKIVRRVFRWDSRFLLGLFRLFGRPLFRYFVIEADGKLVGTTMVTFPSVSAYVSNVVVDPAYRRRGFAKRMLEEAHRSAKTTRRKFVVLDVLETNTGARTLYESMGYRALRARGQYVCDRLDGFATGPTSDPPIRPFARRDAAALVAIVRRQTPPTVEAVLPTSEREFVSYGFVTRLLASQEAAWVIDRGRGAEGHVSASVSEAFEAAHMSGPVVAESVDPELASSLVRTAGAWCAAHQAPRILSMVPDDNTRGRAALEAAGFRHAFALWTLSRPVD